MDAPVLARIRQVFASLRSGALLLDERGRCLIPEGAPSIPVPDDLLPNRSVPRGNYVFRRLSADPDLIVALPAETSSEDLLRLSSALLDALLENQILSDSLSEAYRKLLQEKLPEADVEALALRHAIRIQLERCVILVHAVLSSGVNAGALLRDSIPLTGSDALVPLDSHSVVLIKDMSDMPQAADLKEFALAVEETVLSEEGVSLSMGIGETVSTLSQLGRSFQQAKQALQIGRVFRESEHIHLYQTMLFERLLSEIPPDTAARFHALLFNRKTAYLFNEEMLKTVNVFLENDLNLSETARHLYIHRNTLVYRLDKVQRLVGLDLRRFDDAVTFRLLYELRKSAGGMRRKGF